MTPYSTQAIEGEKHALCLRVKLSYGMLEQSGFGKWMGCLPTPPSHHTQVTKTPGPMLSFVQSFPCNLICDLLSLTEVIYLLYVLITDNIWSVNL